VQDRAGVVLALVGVGAHVGHHVVANSLLVGAGGGVVDVGEVLPQRLDLRLGDRQPQLPFGLGQRYPQLSPGGELVVRRKQVQHLAAGVAAAKRRLVGGFSFHEVSSRKAAPQRGITMTMLRP